MAKQSKCFQVMTVTVMTCVISGCAGVGVINDVVNESFKPLNTYTQQPVHKINSIKKGMSKMEVARILGQPARSEFAGKREAWHYCKTGLNSDEFAVVVFDDEAVWGVKSYGLSSADVGGASGDCAQFIRSIFK